MTAIAHWLVFLICAGQCVASCTRNPRGDAACILIFGTYGLIHGLVPALTPREMFWPYATDDDVNLAGAIALGGIICFWVGWHLYERHRTDWPGLSIGVSRWTASRAGQAILGKLFWASLAISSTAWLLSLVVAAGSLREAFLAARFAYRGNDNAYLVAVLNHVVNLAAVPAFVSTFLPLPLRVLGGAYTGAMAILLFLGSRGGRTVAMSLIGSVLLGYMIRYRLSVRRFCVVAVLASITLTLSVGLYEVRKTMSRATFGDMTTRLFAAETYYGALMRDPLNYHQFLVAAVTHFPADHEYLNGATYRRMLFFFVPRGLAAGLKPDDVSNTFAQVVLDAPFSESTIPPTMPGDGYINFWGTGGALALMLVNGALYAFSWRLVRERVFWFLVLGPALPRYILLGLRGSPYETCALVASSAVLLLVLCWGARLPLNRTERRVRWWNSTRGAEGRRRVQQSGTSKNPMRSGSRRRLVGWHRVWGFAGRAERSELCDHARKTALG